MARTAYFDCFSGVSGDMVLGALLDLGLPLDGLRAALGSLAVDYGTVTAERVLRSGVSATKFRLLTHPQATAPDRQPAGPERGPHEHGHVSHGGGHRHHHHDHHHSVHEIAHAIQRSALSSEGRDRAIHLFMRLAEAEAAIHAMPVEQVHLHEVGALDSIIDVVGTVYGMEWLAAQTVVASPLNVGGGTVQCAHGTFPVPAPATARLLQGAPVYAGAVAHELVTPTGALIVTEYARSFGPIPPMRLDSIGYGAGGRDVEGHPNVLRILVGEGVDLHATETIVVLECEIDDMNPQLFGPLMDRLHETGALDVFYSAVQMKKNRPGVLVTVLAPPSRREALAGLLFAETTTIGVRYREVLRERLEREIRMVHTPVGPIRFKVAMRDGRLLNAAPEFDDCVQAATRHQLAIKDVQAIATKAWLDETGSP